jgi:hypothetical protein
MRHGDDLRQVVCILNFSGDNGRIQDLHQRVSLIGEKRCDSAGDAGSGKSDASAS